MEPKIRVDVVGAKVTRGGSGWGANAHVPALKALADYELKAVCTAILRRLVRPPALRLAHGIQALPLLRRGVNLVA